jgi:hypothetical protein
MNSNRTRTITLVFLGLAVLVGGLFAVLAMASAVPEGSPTVQNVPVVATTQDRAPDAGMELPLVKLDGTWSVERNGTRFVATVANGTINIDIVTSDDTSMTYWNGTFETSESNGETITSTVVNPDLFVLSNATEKDFLVGENTLSFEFQGMGIKSTVVLNRG